jgi:hypothetical protein
MLRLICSLRRLRSAPLNLGLRRATPRASLALNRAISDFISRRSASLTGCIVLLLFMLNFA